MKKVLGGKKKKGPGIIFQKGDGEQKKSSPEKGGG